MHVPPIKISSITDKTVTIYPNENIAVLLNLRGYARLVLNNVPVTLAPNDILVVNSRDLCIVRHSDALVLVVTVERSILNLDTKYKAIYFECNSAKFKYKDMFSPLRTSIVKAVKFKADLTQAKAYSIAYEIFDELIENFSSSAPLTKIKNFKINEIIDYIEKNYSENLLLNDIAERFHISVPYLSKLFKESVGTTFANFYDELRVNHSIYDLTETDENIVDIAYKHGFPNNHAYIRAFKKVMGALPNETRKQYNSNHTQKEADNAQLNEIINLIGLDKTSPSEYEDFYIDVDYSAKSKLILESNPSSEILGVGAAISVLRKNIQAIIKDIQSSSPFRYAYIRGVFSDALSVCSRDYNGNLRFKFAMIDEVLDFLLSVKLMPVISFTYIPKVLAKDKDFTFQDGYYMGEPVRLDEWQQLISNFINHIITRYGFNTISKWIFLPWVQLDSNNKHLGFSNELSFFQFYKSSYCAVKEISKELIVSSPEIYPSENMEYLNNFLLWTKFNNCFPDILSIKFSSNPNWKVIEVKDNRDMAYRKIIDDEISPDENFLHDSLKRLRQFLTDNGYLLDIYVTAFNYTITDSHPVLDTPFSANYYLKSFNDNMEMIKSLCYWKLNDDDQEENTDAPLFSGSTGMFLKNGTPKGIAHAVRYLSYIQPYIVDRGNNYILSARKEQSDYYRLLLYNYEHPRPVKTELLSNPDFDPFSLFVNKKKKAVHFKLNNLPYSKATIKRFIMNAEHGSPYNKWTSMGKPVLDYYPDRTGVISDILKSSAMPDFKIFTVPIIKGTLALELKLDLLDIETIEIILSD